MLFVFGQIVCEKQNGPPARIPLEHVQSFSGDETCVIYFRGKHVSSIFGGSGPLEISDRWQIGQINGHGTEGGE